MTTPATKYPGHEAHRDDAEHDIEAWRDIIAEFDQLKALATKLAEALIINHNNLMDENPGYLDSKMFKRSENMIQLAKEAGII